MATRNNSAARVARLLERVTQAPNQGNAIQGWGRVFGVANADGSWGEREIAQLLSLAQAEIDRVRAILENEKKDPQSYEAILNRADRVFAVQLLASAWANVQQQLGGEVTAGFWLLAEFLPDEEPVAGEEGMKQLMEEIALWEARVTDSDLPEQVKRFLRDQIALIRRAARQYPIRGSSAFGSAAIDAAMAWERSDAEVRPFANTAEVQGIRDLWPAIEKYSKRTILIGGAAAAIIAPVQQILGIVHPPKALPPAIELRIEEQAPGANGHQPPFGTLPVKHSPPSA